MDFLDLDLILLIFKVRFLDLEIWGLLEWHFSLFMCPSLPPQLSLLLEGGGLGWSGLTGDWIS